MGHAIFELDSIGKLPLWAQVLMASRMARRAVLALPKAAPAKTRTALLEGCDAIERCAVAGSWSSEEKVVRKAMELRPSGVAHWAGEAVYLAGDAAHAANDSLDFSAAESACEGSVWRAIQAAAHSGMNPLQAATLMAADLNVLRFACEESRVGRYDGLGKGVMGRMFPVYAPEIVEARRPEEDQPR